MIGYGSVARPYQEHPAEPIQAVHWGGTGAVQWKEGQILYIERAVADIGDSDKGVCSFWVKGLTISSPVISTNALVDSGVGGAIRVTMASGPEAVKMEHLWAANAYGTTTPPADIDWVTTDILDPVPWYHFYIEWNTHDGSQTMTVNGLPAGVSAAVSGAGPPFVVEWKTGPTDAALTDAPNNFHTHIVFLENFLYSEPGPPFYSVAEFWLDLGVSGIGANKFADFATGRPKALGTNGELPKTPPLPPKFYFSRRGAPSTILLNRGSAGAVFLSESIHGSMGVNDRPVVLPENGPIDEPDNPHWPLVT